MLAVALVHDGSARHRNRTGEADHELFREERWDLDRCQHRGEGVAWHARDREDAGHPLWIAPRQLERDRDSRRPAQDDRGLDAGMVHYRDGVLDERVEVDAAVDGFGRSTDASVVPRDDMHPAVGA